MNIIGVGSPGKIKSIRELMLRIDSYEPYPG